MHVDGDDLVFDHMYIERRMTPLNLYLGGQAREDAERAVLDYGQASATWRSRTFLPATCC